MVESSNQMKKLFYSTLILITIFSCSVEKNDNLNDAKDEIIDRNDFNLEFKTIEINIPGYMGPSLVYKDNFYCFYRTEIHNSTGARHQFYIINMDGTIRRKIFVPKELQVPYYDLYVKNDSIFSTEYYNSNTFYLDEKNNNWRAVKKASDLYFSDENYNIYARDYGEWGAITWFENKKSKKQFELGIKSPIVNKLKNKYILTSSRLITEISNPENLTESKEPYDYEEIVVKERYSGRGTMSLEGVKILYENPIAYFSKPKLVINTSFIANDKLYHVYRDSTNLKIGFIKDSVFQSVYEFEKIKHAFRFHYDNRNVVNNNKQSLQFRTHNKNTHGIMFIDNKDVNVTFFKNSYVIPNLGDVGMKKWFEKTFKYYNENIKSITIDDVDSLEMEYKALDVSQFPSKQSYGLESWEVKRPKSYKRNQSKEISLYTSYYTELASDKISIIEFEWSEIKGNKSVSDYIEGNKEDDLILNNHFQIFEILKTTFGEPILLKKENNEIRAEWETSFSRIKLKSTKNKNELRLIKNRNYIELQ